MRPFVVRHPNGRFASSVATLGPQRRVLAWCVATLLCLGSSGAWAGGGVVALQTAAASCGDNSGNRYVDCNNGTVTDNQTGLVWLKQANCLDRCDTSEAPCAVDNDCPPGESCVPQNFDWNTAMDFVVGLSDKPATSEAAAHDCGLSDGSSAGEWRLPSVEEWEAMWEDAAALGCVGGVFGGPAITDDSGNSCWQEGPGSSFTGVRSLYWSSSGFVADPLAQVWVVSLNSADPGGIAKNVNQFAIWPVRGGQ